MWAALLQVISKFRRYLKERKASKFNAGPKKSPWTRLQRRMAAKERKLDGLLKQDTDIKVLPGKTEKGKHTVAHEEKAQVVKSNVCSPVVQHREQTVKVVENSEEKRNQAVRMENVEEQLKRVVKMVEKSQEKLKRTIEMVNIFQEKRIQLQAFKMLNIFEELRAKINLQFTIREKCEQEIKMAENSKKQLRQQIKMLKNSQKELKHEINILKSFYEFISLLAEQSSTFFPDCQNMAILIEEIIEDIITLNRDTMYEMYLHNAVHCYISAIISASTRVFSFYMSLGIFYYGSLH